MPMCRGCSPQVLIAVGIEGSELCESVACSRITNRQRLASGYHYVSNAMEQAICRRSRMFHLSKSCRKACSDNACHLHPDFSQ